MPDAQEIRWLLLIHQIPPKPAYLRVKVWRRLQRVGAVPVKNSVYVLPKNEQTHEDFLWLLREVKESGGDAFLCEARFAEGLSDDAVEQLFRSARDEDYQAVSRESEQTAKSLRKKHKPNGEQQKQLALDLERLQKRLAEIKAIDFFGASNRDAAERALFTLEAQLHDRSLQDKATADQWRIEDVQGRTWVTRKGIHVDRMASAWLVRRFVDETANFKFVPAKGYTPQAGELRFDMYEAEFTHEGDLCTFEVLMGRFGLDNAALRALAEIVHEIDLKDGKFSRPETPGIDRLITGIAIAHNEDEARLTRATALFDDLYEYYRRKRA